MNIHESPVLPRPEAERIRGHFRTIVDFPTPEFPFCDISPALALPDMLHIVTSAFASALSGFETDFVVGVEARGLVLAAPLAAEMQKGLILVRKKGRVPGEKVTAAYSYEYEVDGILELSSTILPLGGRCVVVDDFLATGGTAAAAASLIKRVGGIVSAFAFLIEDRAMGGRKRLDAIPIFTAIDY
jgi:adenine phosphoribosyltransferase